jgi:predicted HicB family RNase H-like nuclease
VRIAKPDIDKRARAAKFAQGEAKGRQPPRGVVRLTVNLDASLHRRFKVEAAAQGVTMGELLAEWIGQHTKQR